MTELALAQAARAASRAGDFPRVLFVTPNAFNHLTGGGVTFSNLFAGWPKDRLATVHNDPVPTSDDVCERYFVLGREEIDLFAPLRIVRALRARRAAGPHGEARNGGVGANPSRGLLARLHGDSAPQRARLTAELMRWIEAFRPQLLYSILGSNAFMTLTADIRRTFGLPMVVHLMDDYPSINHRRGLFAPIERRPHAAASRRQHRRGPHPHGHLHRDVRRVLRPLRAALRGLPELRRRGALAAGGADRQRGARTSAAPALFRLHHPQCPARLADRPVPVGRAAQCGRHAGRARYRGAAARRGRVRRSAGDRSGRSG